MYKSLPSGFVQKTTIPTTRICWTCFRYHHSEAEVVHAMVTYFGLSIKSLNLVILFPRLKFSFNDFTMEQFASGSSWYPSFMFHLYSSISFICIGVILCAPCCMQKHIKNVYLYGKLHQRKMSLFEVAPPFILR